MNDLRTVSAVIRRDDYLVLFQILTFLQPQSFKPYTLLPWRTTTRADIDIPTSAPLDVRGGDTVMILGPQ